MAQNVVALPGDGIGREVLPVGLQVLEALQEKHNLDIDVQSVQCGAQYYAESGQEWEEGGLEACGDADGVLLGAVGWPGVSLPNGDIAGTGVVFGLRFGLDLYANVRPCKLYEGVPHMVSGKFMQVWEPENVDMVIFRENTEGSYTPVKGYLDRAGTQELAVDSRVITRKGSERIIQRAFDMAESRKAARKAAGKESQVTCIDKSNVRAGCRLFRSVYDEVAANHPDINKNYAYVDAFTQSLVRNPEWYDVAVATNMLGDIVTDLAAVLQGGMGMAGSGNIGDNNAVFEPVHGSWPQVAGQDVANPYAMVQCVGMMLDHMAAKGAGQRYADASLTLDQALRTALKDRVWTSDLGGDMKCSAVGDRLTQTINAL